MKRILIAGAIVLAASLSAEAAAKHHRRPQSDVTIWNKDSRNPNVGWHTENGMRVCTHDCENPEIPGSGARCKTITFMGMRGRECTTGSW